MTDPMPATNNMTNHTMNPEQQQAILTIALLAAFADGTNDDREREEIRRLAESLGSELGAPNLAGLYREVLLKRVDLSAAAAVLSYPEHRQLAYEMAVCICDADGSTTEAERQFLTDLSRTLSLDTGVTDPLNRQAAAMADLIEAAAPVAAVSRILDESFSSGVTQFRLRGKAYDIEPHMAPAQAIIDQAVGAVKAAMKEAVPSAAME